MRCSPFSLSVDRGASIHGLIGTEDARAFPFGCSRPEKVNGFMLHVAAYVMHSLLLGSDASQSLPCLASQEPRVAVDAWPAWHRLHAGIIVLIFRLQDRSSRLDYCMYTTCMPQLIDALPAPRHQTIAWCSLFGLSGGKGVRKCMI